MFKQLCVAIVFIIIAVLFYLGTVTNVIDIPMYIIGSITNKTETGTVIPIIYDDNIKILYYKNFQSIVRAGLIHVTSMFMHIIQEGLCMNYTHVIIESFTLTGNHNNGKTIIKPGYFYYDYDSLSKATGIKVLHYEWKEAKELIHVFGNKNKSIQIYMEKSNNCPIKINDTYSLVYKVGFHPYWESFKCCQKYPKVIGNPLKVSKNIENCIIDFKNTYINSNKHCLIVLQVRRGDRFHEYSKYNKNILNNNIPAIYLYIAQHYCHKNDDIYTYLATDGEPEYSQKVRDGIISNAVKIGLNVTYLDKEYWLHKTSQCRTEFTRNNYALFLAEKCLKDQLNNTYYSWFHPIIINGKNSIHVNGINILYTDLEKWAKNVSVTYIP